ncbi:YggS family pyridoxal phosphate-dependent enzyme [Myxococcota bacterium]|nr:YggS family pyridoxal phosphate-dependent enzyme [Myxococcota bacterium]MBU1380953.1 YggS family pyridoxal phosphate-dependent enzyme [Myxococcota bacterium]MBU1495761.1 YggS family pyridoxal phosphate-dependent enzyme [Myxococcota bacterium]
MSIRQNLETLRRQIDEVAVSCGRDPGEIGLLAVSKYHDISSILEAYNAGHRDFAENYVQELSGKIPSAPADVNWHFIGPLQSNKLKDITGQVELIHCVSTVKHLLKIDGIAREKGITQNILFQLKTSHEESKAGCSEEELDDLFAALTDCSSVCCQGFMTMPPFFDDPEMSVPYFEKTSEVFRKYAAGNHPNFKPVHLSMGMTGDFAQAIRCGSTILRIGTAIFGERNY